MTRQDPVLQRMQSDSLTAIAALITMIGGSGLLLAGFAEIPGLLIAMSALLFLVGWMTAIVAAVADARRNGKTIPQALGDGLTTIFRWLLRFMP